MRICYFTHDLYSHTGIGTLSRGIIEGVARKHPDWKIGVVVEVACGHVLEIGKVRPRITSFFRLRSFFKNYDVVHALDGYPYGFLAVLSTLGLGNKVYITAIGSGGVHAFSKFRTKAFIRWGYRHADKVFALSANTARIVKEYMPKLSITPVTPGIDVKKFNAQKEDRGGLPDVIFQKPYILSVGSFKDRKGFRECADAFIEAAPKVPDLHYVFASNPNNKYAQTILEKFKKHGLMDRVHVLEGQEIAPGHVFLTQEQLFTLYKNARLFMMMPQEFSHNDIEGFGLVFLEAAAVGLPIITSREGPAPEAVSEDNSAFMFNPRDTKHIADAIVRIVSDRVLWERMSKASRQFAEHMSWDRTVNIYLSHYY